MPRFSAGPTRLCRFSSSSHKHGDGEGKRSSKVLSLSLPAIPFFHELPSTINVVHDSPNEIFSGNRTGYPFDVLIFFCHIFYVTKAHEKNVFFCVLCVAPGLGDAPRVRGDPGPQVCTLLGHGTGDGRAFHLALEETEREGKKLEKWTFDIKKRGSFEVNLFEC